MIYKAVGGSRTYDLSIGCSDLDVAIVTSKKLDRAEFRRRDEDMYLWTPEEFAVFQQGSCRRWFNFSLLFPYECYVENDLSKWIVENREDMIRAWLPNVYETYSSACTEFARNRNGKNKHIAYAIHFRNMLANYAEGMPFAEAIKATGDCRTFLLSVRNGIAPKELVIEETVKARERAKSVAGFYAEPKADLSILDEFKYMVYRENEKLQEN